MIPVALFMRVSTKERCAVVRGPFQADPFLPESITKQRVGHGPPVRVIATWPALADQPLRVVCGYYWAN